MKTLADFKRATQIGTWWNCYHVGSDNDLGTRQIIFKNTVKITFQNPDNSESRLNYPQRDLIEFHGDEVRIFTRPCLLNNWPRRHILTYKMINKEII